MTAMNQWHHELMDINNKTQKKKRTTKKDSEYFFFFKSAMDLANIVVEDKGKIAIMHLKIKSK